MSPLFLALIILAVFIYTQMYALLLWHVWRVGRMVPEGGYWWKLAGFTIGFIGVLIQFVTILVLVAIDSPELEVFSTSSGLLRIGIGLGISFSALGCLLIAYRKLHKALAKLLRLKEKTNA